MKRGLIVACLLALASASVWAGADKAMSAKQMEMMKAEMSKCVVCKNMAAHLDEIGPSLKMEAVTMNNGMAVVHTVGDPTKVAVFHKACDETMKAGQASATLTDEQAATQLCPFCQGIRSAVKAGAKMSAGQTKNGDLMVLSSDDPAVQTQISALREKCAMMAGEGQATR